MKFKVLVYIKIKFLKFELFILLVIFYFKLFSSFEKKNLRYNSFFFYGFFKVEIF